MSTAAHRTQIQPYDNSIQSSLRAVLCLVPYSQGRIGLCVAQCLFGCVDVHNTPIHVYKLVVKAAGSHEVVVSADVTQDWDVAQAISYIREKTLNNRLGIITLYADLDTELTHPLSADVPLFPDPDKTHVCELVMVQHKTRWRTCVSDIVLQNAADAECIVAHPVEPVVAIVYSDTVNFVNTETQESTTLSKHPTHHTISSLFWNSTGTLLSIDTTGDRYNCVEIWEYPQRRLRHTLSPAAESCSNCWDSTGRFVVTVNDSKLVVWNVADEHTLERRDCAQTNITHAVCCSPTHPHVVCLVRQYDKSTQKKSLDMCVFDIFDDTLKVSLPGLEFRIPRFLWSPCGKYIASTTLIRGLKVRKASTLEIIFRINLNERPTGFVRTRSWTWHPRGPCIGCVTRYRKHTGSIKLWSVTTPHTKILALHDDEFASFCWSASADRLLFLWNNGLLRVLE